VPRPSLADLTRVILRISNTTFGGGYITMAALKRELVDDRHWITETDYALSFALARITPGTNIIAFCAGVGSVMRGIPGAIAAVVAGTVPSAMIALLLMVMFDSWQHNPIMAAALAAALAAACGMLWSVVITIVRPLLGSIMRTFRAVVIVVAAFVVSWVYGWTPVPIILATALIGYFWKDPTPESKPAKEQQPA
jgi:chromate transporter